MSIFLRNLLLRNPKSVKHFSVLYDHSQLFRNSLTKLKLFQTKNVTINDIQLIRNKYNKSTNKNNKSEDSDSDLEEVSNAQVDKDSNIIKITVNSLRADLILKAGLGLARNKVETIFYESKIRVNGEKIVKKSLKLNVGDEVDIIKGPSSINPDHLVVARVEILSAIPRNESISVTLLKNRSLVIENYTKNNEWKVNGDNK